jgi:uncharacterized membrane protein YhaH (DUF805 family)
MIITILGWVLCSFAIIVFAFKLLVVHGEASDPQGGGGAPTLDGVIFPPIFLAVGLGLLDRRYSDFSLPGWSYVCIWLVGTVLIYTLHELIYRVVHSRARKKMERHDTVA